MGSVTSRVDGKEKGRMKQRKEELLLSKVEVQLARASIGIEIDTSAKMAGPGPKARKKKKRRKRRTPLIVRKGLPEVQTRGRQETKIETVQAETQVVLGVGAMGVLLSLLVVMVVLVLVVPQERGNGWRRGKHGGCNGRNAAVRSKPKIKTKSRPTNLMLVLALTDYHAQGGQRARARTSHTEPRAATQAHQQGKGGLRFSFSLKAQTAWECAHTHAGRAGVGVSFSLQAAGSTERSRNRHQ
jgi:hypothetical protein